MLVLTCSDNDWLSYKEHLEGVPILRSPVSVGVEYLLPPNGGQVPQKETRCWPWNASQLPFRLPVCAIANNLVAEKASFQ